MGHPSGLKSAPGPFITSPSSCCPCVGAQCLLLNEQNTIKRSSKKNPHTHTHSPAVLSCLVAALLVCFNLDKRLFTFIFSFRLDLRNRLQPTSTEVCLGGFVLCNLTAHNSK